MSCRLISNIGLETRWATLLLEPVKKLSRQMTSQPHCTRRSHKWLPRNPAPPVTRTRLGVVNCSLYPRAGLLRRVRYLTVLDLRFDGKNHTRDFDLFVRRRLLVSISHLRPHRFRRQTGRGFHAGRSAAAYAELCMGSSSTGQSDSRA